MKIILTDLLQVILASGILYGYYWTALRNKRFHRYNRFYLLAATGLSLTIPFLNIPLYFSQAETDSSFLLRNLASDTIPAEAGLGDPHSIPAVLSAESWFTLPHFLLLAYFLIAALILLRVLHSFISIRKIIRKYPSERIGDIHFVNTNEPGTPFSFFRWLFWDRKIGLRSVKGEQIFRHEMYHINEKHSIDTVFMEVINMVCWINPFFWLIRKELRVIHEFLADQFAVQENNQYDYAELLLMQVLGTENRLTQPFFHNQIKRRILMLTNSQQPRHQYLRKLMLLPMAAVLTGLFAFSYHRKDEPVHAKPVVVMIDAGHGGTETGVMSGNVKECDLNLQLAKMIQSLNDDPSIQVILTRKGDETLTAQERLNLSKQMRADLFISLHVNAAGTLKNAQTVQPENKQGIEVYGASRSLTENSRILASALINSMKDIYPTDPQIKQRKEGIYVLDRNPAPAVLMECGYINNAADLAFISDPANQQKIAKAILNAVREFSLRRVADMRVYQDTNTPSVRVVRDAKPPVKPTEAELRKFLDAKTYGVWVDEHKILNSQLSKYKASDFANHDVSKLEKNAIHYHEYKYQVSLYTNSWFSKYGNKGQYPDTLMWVQKQGAEKPASKALLVVDGKEIGRLDDMKNLNEALDLNDVESVYVLKGDAAMKKYGDKGKEGVIEIITKGKQTGVKEPGQLPPPPTADEDKIFTKVEIEASFPGGTRAWNSFLDKELNRDAGIQQGAPKGEFTVILQFVVNTDGTISDIKPLTNYGFGMEEEAIRVMKKSPKWNPCIQNGRQVKAYQKVKIDFFRKQGPEIAVHGSTPLLPLHVFKSANPRYLLGLSPEAEILSYMFTIDQADQSIVQTYNSGERFSDATRLQIASAVPGRMLTLDQIRVRLNGEERKMPAKVYQITD